MGRGMLHGCMLAIAHKRVASCFKAIGLLIELISDRQRDSEVTKQQKEEG
jgi:hypothetical protein